jgi:hypothetical protein
VGKAKVKAGVKVDEKRGRGRRGRLRFRLRLSGEVAVLQAEVEAKRGTSSRLYLQSEP